MIDLVGDALESRSRSGRAAVVAFAILVVLFVAYLGLGMPGMDHGSGGGTTGEMQHDVEP